MTPDTIQTLSQGGSAQGPHHPEDHLLNLLRMPHVLQKGVMAEKRYMMAIPASIMVSGVMPLYFASPYTAKDARTVNINALPTINHCPPTNPAPMTMARAAPKLAAEEMPKVNGLARGFLRMPCITAPATARPMPPTIARRMRCSRRPQTMVSENQLVWK